MIARIWHGAVPTHRADDYHRYLMQTGLSDYAAAPGNLGTTVLRRAERSVSHFLVLSYWESLDAIRAFAGDDVEKARYYPDDEVFLIELEPEVAHYEVLQS